MCGKWDKTQIKAPPVGSEGSGYFLEQYPINIIYSVDKTCAYRTLLTVLHTWATDVITLFAENHSWCLHNGI